MCYCTRVHASPGNPWPLLPHTLDTPPSCFATRIPNTPVHAREPHGPGTSVFELYSRVLRVNPCRRILELIGQPGSSPVKNVRDKNSREMAAVPWEQDFHGWSGSCFKRFTNNARERSS